MATQDIVKRLMAKGYSKAYAAEYAEGYALGCAEMHRETLLTIYRVRFGAVPRKVRAAIERTRDNAVLAKWVALFTVRSVEEIAAAVEGKKASLDDEHDIRAGSGQRVKRGSSSGMRRGLGR